jgi:hypothetical protein
MAILEYADGARQLADARCILPEFRRRLPRRGFPNRVLVMPLVVDLNCCQIVGSAFYFLTNRGTLPTVF